MSEADVKAVEDLAGFGFDPNDALEAYLSCDRNQEIAANLLFENY
jgi:UV excision repair protein RAD23